MKKQIIIFFAIGFCLFILANHLLVPKWNDEQFGDNYSLNIKMFEKMDEEIDVFFLGSSHVEFGVLPMQLYRDDGIVSYNLASAKQPLAVSEYFTKEIFRRGFRPKVLVLDVSSLFYSCDGDYSIHYITDSSVASINKYRLIWNCYQDYFDKEGMTVYDSISKIVSYVFPFYFYHDRWYELSFKDILPSSDSDYFMQGATIYTYTQGTFETSDDVNSISKWIKDYYSQDYYNILKQAEGSCAIDANDIYNREVLSDGLKYIDSIRNICKKNDCQLLLIKVPVNKNPIASSASWTIDRHNAIMNMVKKNGDDFFDAYYESEFEMDWYHDTFDYGGHLNYCGAEKYTQILGQYLLKHYNIPSQNSKSYDRKLVLYDEYIRVANIETEYDFLQYLCRLVDSSNDLVILLSVRNDMITGLNEAEKAALHSLNLTTDYEQMQLSNSYIAVINEGSVEFEAVSNRKQYYETLINGCNIKITSAGYLGGDISSILIDGEEKSMNSPGLNFLVIDKKSGLIIDRSSCNTLYPDHEVIHADDNLICDYQDYLMGRYH